MTSVSPPTYYFDGITFNSAFYTTSSSGGLSQAQANALYLKKNTTDTATALEKFTGGIVSDSYDSSTSSATTTLAANNLTGNINIGNGNRTAGTINIGTGTTSATTATINIGNDLTNTNVKGAISVYGINPLTTGLQANILNLGAGSATTTVNLGTNANVTSMAVGSSSTIGQFNGYYKFSNALQTPSIDAALSGGTFQLCPTYAGSIALGSSTIPTTAAGGLSLGTGTNITLQPITSWTAPTMSQLGYSVAIPTVATFKTGILNGSTGYAYYPAVGTAAFQLVPGTYTMSLYCFSYFSGTITSTTCLIEMGIISSTTTTPSSTSQLFNTRIAPYKTDNSTSTNTYFPTYTFTVVTTNYYYAMCGVSSVSIVGGGNISVGVQLLGLTRIA